MKFPGNWLRKLVDYQCSDEELAHKLTMAGLEVESVVPVAPFFDKVVIAEVMSVQKHANADRLRVCKVDVGNYSDEPLQIVCGAQNVTEGMKTVCALIGARLPELNIRQGKIRGVESFGMLCSARELGLESEADGLIELPDDAPAGISFREYDGLDDSIFTLKLTPNRADCLGMFGIAREVAAITAGKLNLPEIKPVNPEIADVLRIRVEEPQSCPLYCGRIVKGIITSTQTPLWMNQYLVRAGLRLINPVVDIINYVMLETGQPMHAFDLAKIEKGAEQEIRVRYAVANERLRLLNGECLDLQEDLLVIADSSKPLALAGIMGGSESEVEGGTTDIFIESAFFSPAAISGKSFKLGFSSDSSHRFERGVDFSMTRNALERATALVLDICGGKIGPVVEVSNDLPRRDAVEVRQKRIAKILGVDFGIELISEYFRRLQFGHSVSGDTFYVVPPASRFDLVIEEDFIEELARMHGYDLIPAQLPKASAHMLTEPEIGIAPVKRLRQILVARDYQEVINYTFVDTQWEADLCGNNLPVKLKNPIASHMDVMRSSLFGGLINNLQFNLNRKQSRVRIFEIGSCFSKDNDEEKEVENLAVLCSGNVHPEQWGVTDRDVDFYDVKMDVESLFWPRNIDFESAVHPALHPGKSARILIDKSPIGWIGELHPRWQRKYHLSQSAILFELQIEALASDLLPMMQVLSKFPPVRRDIAVVVENEVSMAKLLEAMNSEKDKSVSEISLFDLYSGENLEQGKKSLAFRILLQGTEKNLTDQEIDQAVNGLINVLGRKFGATLRG
ncbi:phenylalanyl-tRNA synthetase beta subunit [Nitrosomonas eutropha]|uniref:phenylalanine--tRNA ligase subunit beta n=1 Tax=Nitrosomonas TaxID=914 RepID=UPI00089BAF0D|nr:MULTISPECIES: phenylalanine--tRNA ligase subunit beta [Nitrosomonas]MXS80756.1 phenylalanine--tRNA ligase subunit beta [Nitrosomonas sp. GH22]SDX08953.1 phenylalanyl-tRNA synthetase beta subunit [Nitrosomonas eutropha]